MKQVVTTGDGVMVWEVPAPVVEAGTVLVAVDHSCVSIGTELSGVRHAETPLWKRALRDPAKVKAVIGRIREQGFAEVRRSVQDTTSSVTAMGYSAAGTVIEVGAGIDDVWVGDRVACAGAGIANHAEVVRVPRNLVVPVPDGLDLAAASTVTLGAIALQGIRRAEPTLGETFVVVGLGAIGQLSAQLLRAAGCRVVVADLDPERAALAVRLGADLALEGPDQVEAVMRLTDGVGADGVIIAAASSSDEVLAFAFHLCRKKARVVVVGDVGLGIRREDIYAKELDFLISTSYGPGRYDRSYEHEGLEYPIGYVRWTENRNMREYLRLVGDQRIDVGSLISRVVPVDDAARAYSELEKGDRKPQMVLLSYSAPDASPTRLVGDRSRPVGRGKLGFAVVGPGALATGVHLPNLAATDGVEVRAIVGRTGHSAAAVAQRFGAAYSTTDLEHVLSDDAVDAVVVCTRHRDHAELVLQCLAAGKHVLIEKPLAVDRAELASIAAAVEAAADPPILLTGFNRRFSPSAVALRDRSAARSNPLVMSYRMNAGYLPPTHWVHGDEGRGRNIGEACHIYDLFTALTGAESRAVTATAVRPATDYYLASDNFVATVAFDDGSVATLTYTALGSTEFPKEQLTVYVDGTVWTLDDYRRLEVVPGSAPSVAAGKGHPEELAAFVEGIRTGVWPVPLWQQVQAMEIAFTVEDSISPAAGAT